MNKLKALINFLDHDTLDKLYLMVFPNGNMIIPKGSDYQNFGPFLERTDFEEAINISQFDSAKHLRHSQGWRKEAESRRQVQDARYYGLDGYFGRTNL